MPTVTNVALEGLIVQQTVSNNLIFVALQVIDVPISYYESASEEVCRIPSEIDCYRPKECRCKPALDWTVRRTEERNDSRESLA